MTLDELLDDIFGVKPVHTHMWVRVSPFGWFSCPCGASTHSLACWNGTWFDCCCGLEEADGAA